MVKFYCESCGFQTDDPSLYECPRCGNYLKEEELEMDVLENELRQHEAF